MVDEADAAEADLLIRMLDAQGYDWDAKRCDRCCRIPVGPRATYCADCLAEVTRERSSRAARAERKAAKAAMKPVADRAKPDVRTMNNPARPGDRLPKEKVWLVLEKTYGPLSVVTHGGELWLTPAEWHDQRRAVDENGLTADDWLKQAS